MPSINNAEKVREWLRACPHIAQGRFFGADYLGENATEYTLVTVPSGLRYRENICGKRTLLTNQEQHFSFAAVVPYGADVEQNLENLGFFQDVATWIAEQNAAGLFPEWDGGTVYAIEATDTGAPMEFGANWARYQFQIRVCYKIN